MREAAALAALLAVAAACRDVNVVTASYATLAEAAEAGAIEGGWVPRGLPEGTREIRAAHDPDSTRRWGLFNFPAGEAEALRTWLGADVSMQNVRCDPPRRIEWWPVLLRGPLNEDQVRATGLRTYAPAGGDLVFLVNWNQGRAYYCTRE
jgi:hypothetical protein